MIFTNEEKAIKELHCYMYCMEQSAQEFRKENFTESALYLENAARSLKELERMKKSEDESNHIVNIFVIGRNHDSK